MFKKILVSIIISFSLFSVSSAYELNKPDIKPLYNNIINKFIKKYWEKQTVEIIKGLNLKLEILSKSNKYKDKLDLIDDLRRLGYEWIFNYDLEYNLENNESFQKIKELTYRKNFSSSIDDNFSEPSFLNSFKDAWFSIYRTNENLEYLDWASIKKFNFSKYFIIDSNNYKVLLWKSWIVLTKKNSWEYWFLEDFTTEEKIPYSKAKDYFYDYIKEDYNFFYKWNDLYTYNFDNFSFFDSDYWFYLSEIDNSSIDRKTTILYKDRDWNYKFIKTFQEERLVSNDIVFWEKLKKQILDNIKDDKKYLSGDNDKEYEEIKELSLSLTKWLSDQEKIKKVYAWILENITYTTNFNLSDYRIYSWVLTYKYQDGVCDWYVKLFAYLLEFSWFENLEIIRWYVLDAKDFPQVGHAWIKIWDYYYDPTFDDPIWSQLTKSFSEYKYYKLPKDLFYANRFLYDDIPEELEISSEYFRRNYIDKKLYELSTKYDLDDYLILQPFIFRKENWLSYSEEITIDKLKNILPYFEVSDFKYTNNWKELSIKKLSYYGVDDSSISDILSQLNYKLDSYYLFKWDLWDWNYEYRLAYDLEI